MKKKIKPSTRISSRRDREPAKPPVARLQRLAKAIAQARPVSKRPPLSHADCEATVEFFVDTERRGEQAQTLYPDVWKHLQSCSRCRASYSALAEALGDTEPLDPALEPNAPELKLPFLVPAREDTPWNIQVHSRIAGAPLGFSLSLRKPFLWNQLATPGTVLSLRDGPSARRSVLLLSDVLSLSGQPVDVEVRAIPSEDAQSLQLQVSLASSSPLPDPFQATLAWNDHQLSGLVHKGRAVFEGVPFSDLRNAGDLRFEFQSKEGEGVEPRGSNP